MDISKFLEENYVKLGCKVCSEMLGLPYNKTQYAARKLGLRKYHSKPWTEEEILILKTYYPTYGAQKCKELLPHRTVTAIQKYAENHNILCDIVVQRNLTGIRKSNLPRNFYNDSLGYVIYLIDGDRNNKILYHRYIMEQHIGRKLTSEDIVHHLDGDKSNNDIPNLELTNRAAHMSKHRVDLVKI